MKTLTTFYITNSPAIALIAEKYGVDRIWVDLETLGKEDRQKSMNTVKSQHEISDIAAIKPLLTKAEMLVRINPWHEGSVDEVEAVISAGADIIMLPYWKSAKEVQNFVATVQGRCKTTLLLETREAVDCLDEVLNQGGFDEIHIGLNDLHLSYGMTFMFELLADGMVENLCNKFKAAGIPYGFGGIARLGEGLLPAEKIIMEHYRLGSTRVILSRTFCDSTKMKNLDEIDRIFCKSMLVLHKYEKTITEMTEKDFIKNQIEISTYVKKIVANRQEATKDIKGDKNMLNVLNIELLDQLSTQYGDSFYLLDTGVFEQNYHALLDAFRYYYPQSNIAYSYKTNYIPKLVKTIDKLGGYAEVVSDMEMEVALRAGVSPARIIWNGPVKNLRKVRELLQLGGTVNLDSSFEIAGIKEIAIAFPERTLNVGVRLNYEVGDGVLSRFGFDVESEDFREVLNFIATTPNLNLINLQAHFAKRKPEYWTARAEGMLRAYDVALEMGLSPSRLDIGGGIYGSMCDDLREQLHLPVYTFDDYASRAAKVFAHRFKDNNSPWLFIEPGTAVAANCMRYVCKVETIKKVRGKAIATVNGSQKNISMNNLNPPLEVIAGSGDRQEYNDLDMAGYTCIESDILYKGYTGLLGTGDYVVFGSCGSYSLVMKPPFIMPNVAVVDISGENVELIKRKEVFDDLFHTFNF